jgi:hypothetical protein
MEPMGGKAEWSIASTMSGAQCVMINGVLLMLKWCADSWVLLLKVCHDQIMVYKSIIWSILCYGSVDNLRVHAYQLRIISTRDLCILQESLSVLTCLCTLYFRSGCSQAGRLWTRNWSNLPGQCTMHWN